jgi:hypothetical protein
VLFYIEKGDNVIKILDTSLNTLAILQNVVASMISEGLNREFTFDFQTVIDGDKSQYLTYTNKIEVEDNYFNMILLKKSRTQDGLFFDISCEHVSYDLLSANFTAGFTATGLFSAVATTLLAGTGFTVGTVQITASGTTSLNESTNAMSILKHLASVIYDGELQFDKYQINLLTRRGADRGVQFRYRKNITNATVTVDARQKTAGVPKIIYEVSPAELEFESSYIANGYATNESYELGDTIRVIDPDLDIDASLRIVKESHNTEQRMLGVVEISNFVDDITDTITNIQTTTIVKDTPYNNVSLGPDLGFVAERSDSLVKTMMNATNGYEIDLRNTITASYTPVFYVQVDTATGTAKLYLSGNAVFTGQVVASDIIGGTITIGTGSNTFNANGTNGIWLGYSAFATAPFSVTLSGAVTADNMLLTGATMQIGTSNNTFRFDEASGLWMGNTVFGSAPFRVTMSGSLTAQNAEIIGDIKAGSTFTVATGSNTVRADSSGLYVGSSAFATAPFRVMLSGAVTASNIDVTGGSINVSTDAYVGNNLILGSLNDLEKKITLYNNAIGNANITYDVSGNLTIDSFYDMTLDTLFGTMNLNSLSDIRLFSAFGDITIESTGLNSTSALFGVFGNSAAQQTAQKLTAAATLGDCIIKINGILDKLGLYGLFVVSEP